ncbi:hypothetical protein L596_002346 [Steinernema carpocapsae]|nr:hypothetical protein L596_002346 [Steinernema carpocapsae]
MDKFMETYPDARKGRLEELDNIGTEVIKLLTLIALNKHKVEVIEPVSTIDDEMVNDLLNSSASADELQSVHLSIQEEMASLSTLRYQLKEDIGNLTERRRQLSAQFRSHGDEGGGQRTKLSSQLEAVNRRLRAAEADLPDVEGRLEQLLEEQSHFNDKFSGNEHFPKLRALQAELRTLTNGNADLKKDLNSVEAETNYDALKEESANSEPFIRFCGYNANTMLF